MRVVTCHYNHDGDKIAVVVVNSNQLFISPSLLEKIARLMKVKQKNLYLAVSK